MIEGPITVTLSGPPGAGKSRLAAALRTLMALLGVDEGRVRIIDEAAP